ncbi:MAG: hypothetical protein AMXMBFR58_24370 [Phycisphaerae bacterium]
MSRHEATLRQAQRLIALGRPDQARSTITRLLEKEPAEPWLNNAMAVTFVVGGQFEQAHYYASRAVKASPTNTEALCTLGSVLSALGRHAEAVEVLERAISIDPQSTNARLSIANALAGLDQHGAAAEHCRAALAVSPDDREVTTALMQALLNTGNVKEALGIAAAKIPTWPPSVEIASWVPYAMNYLATTTPAASLEAHTRFGRTLADLNRTVDGGGSRPHANPPDPDRTLRIGLVSPDFRVHSVAFFIEPLLEHADRSRLHLTCYSTSPTEDAVTQRLRSLADQWRSVVRRSSAEIAAQIRSDRIDVLVDLAGLTAGEKLSIFFHRPAPVQVTYLGYPNTTGVEAIGFRIVDSRTDPPGAETWCTERLLRLDPCFLCYMPPAHSPDPTPAVPSAASGHVTFGSFNTLIKLSDATVELWSRVLERVPGSRLLLKCRQLADPRTRTATVERFVRCGIDPSRIEVLPATKSLADHLALYSRVDVGLDPTPYAGTTTTCEAMWMGVPVVTLAGASHASRVGVSLLTNVGLEECITRSPEAFVDAAAVIAADHKQRGVLRSAGDQGLRRRMMTSALCDGPGFAKRFEACLRTTWTAWCRDHREPA